MTAASTALLAACVTAGMRASIWPPLSIAAGIGLLALIVLGQFAVLVGAFPEVSPTLGQAFESALRSRKAWSAALFVAAMPTFLVLAGLTGLFRRSGPAVEAC